MTIFKVFCFLLLYIGLCVGNKVLNKISANQYINYNLQPQSTNCVKNCVIPPMPGGKRSEQTSFKGDAPVSNPIVAKAPAEFRTEFATQEEQTKFANIASVLDPKERKILTVLLKKGVLLSSNSNDKSTTLDSLYKMISTPRANGLDAKTVLSDTINTIANPFIITQNFGNIPKEYENDILQKAESNPKNPDDKIDKDSIKVDHSSACVSASIEFNLASQMPSEFARFAEGLTSPKMAVDKTVSLKNLTDNTLDSVWLLDTFEIPYEMHDFDKAKLTLAPDKNAYIRAQIQNHDKDNLERSVVDVLMQSTFMNVGSEQTYDSLTDNRNGAKFNNVDNKGLIEFEKTFTESIVQDKNKISVTYQNLDEKGKVIPQTQEDYKKIIKNIADSLAIGDNVIIGYTMSIKNKDLVQPDKTKKPDEEILSGHEITVIGLAKDKEGHLLFICNDTDDNNPNPVIYPAEFIVPKIHHAGLPQKIAEKDMPPSQESWKEGLKTYQEAKNNKQA